MTSGVAGFGSSAAAAAAPSASPKAPEPVAEPAPAFGPPAAPPRGASSRDIRSASDAFDPAPPAPPSTPAATPLVDAASDDQVKFGFQLLEAVKAGALDMASAQKQLRDLMVSGTPPPATPPGARVASTPEAARPAIPPSPGAMPKGFAPVCVAASPGACPRDSPTPSWGVKVAAARSTASSASSPAPGSGPATPVYARFWTISER